MPALQAFFPHWFGTTIVLMCFSAAARSSNLCPHTPDVQPERKSSSRSHSSLSYCSKRTLDNHFSTPNRICSYDCFHPLRDCDLPFTSRKVVLEVVFHVPPPDLNMAVCASRLLCSSLRWQKLQRVIRFRQAARSESRPGRALRLPCSILLPPSLCSLPVISRDVPERAHLQSNSTSTGTPLISFGIIGSGRKGHQVAQLASYDLNRMEVTAVDV
ncbi:unnamed protein product [Polarella glacialis]|uniref:Uncharacterized protein n=1 Tax=Polarella glacialis TaxID=89957 RepID=A0A813HCE4_POLGL|nr:unnamed protein product [Polarella glacialis]